MKQAENKILLHACCAICSAHPIELLKSMGYEVIVYFYNPNIYPIKEYEQRLETQKILCKYFGVELIVGNYDIESYYLTVKGLENEPERGLRCDKCFKLRLTQTAQKAKEIGIENFSTSIVISPHKSFTKITTLGEKIALDYNLNYIAIDFKKKDGFLRTNTIARELNLYRQNYCGCKFSLSN